LGEDKGPRGCQRSDSAVCNKCSTIWRPPDTSLPGRCPTCESYEIAIARCDRCPLDALDHVRQRSQAGRLLERVLQLDFVFPAGSALPWGELTCADVKGLQILRQERDKYQREKMPLPNGDISN
jgi:hypothetical protein